jgi:hypothetical protein
MASRGDDRYQEQTVMSLQRLWERVVQVYADIMVIIVLVGAPLGALHQLVIIFGED